MVPLRTFNERYNYKNRIKSISADHEIHRKSVQKTLGLSMDLAFSHIYLYLLIKSLSRGSAHHVINRGFQGCPPFSNTNKIKS